MDEKNAQQLLIEILYATVNELETYDSIKPKLTSDVPLSVYRLAKKHDLAHVVSKFIYQNHVETDRELQEQLQREELISIYRYEQIQYSFEEICGAFNEAEIPYVPLKGSVIRPYYPYESMRTSCDVDVLIHESDLEAAIRCLESKGYRCGDRAYHDVSLFSPSNVHLELHFHIQESMDSLDCVLKDAWSHAALSEGSRYDFSKEFFVFHMYAHMAYHFVSGGCGIRSLLDIWVMEHKMGVTYICAEELLKKAGIYTFACEMSRIANICFTQSEQDEFSDLVLKYIYSGGVYGTKENQISAKKAKKGSSFRYVWDRLFLPYRTMVLLYPVLKKLPILLPFCWMMRWFSVLFKGKSQRVAAELSCLNRVSDARISEITEMRSRLDI